MTTLQRTSNEVKKAARDSVVRITEQGAGAYIFCSEDAFEKRIAREREDAAYEARLLEAAGRGVADIEASSIHHEHRRGLYARRRVEEALCLWQRFGSLMNSTKTSRLSIPGRS